MHSLLTAILQFSYIGIFVVIFAESGFLLGFFLPGDSLLFTAGLLSASGVFNIWVLLPLSIVAAILGDSFGYYWGKELGPKIFAREDSLLFRKSYVERTHAFFEKHGKKTIILARFVPIIRTFAPIFAGVGNMAYKTFLAFNVLGGFLWAGLVTFVGFSLGKTFPGIERSLTFVILAIVAISVWPIARELFRGKFLRTILNVNFFSFLFFDLLAALRSSQFLLGIDREANRMFLGSPNTSFTDFMHYSTGTIAQIVLSAAVLIFLIFFLTKKEYRNFFIVFFSTAGGLLLSSILKLLFRSSRPPLSLFTESTYGFPSGHAVMSVICFGLLFLFLRHKHPFKSWRAVLDFVLIAAVLFVGFNRLYLGVHWLSDVLGGYAVGLFCLSGAILVMHLFSTHLPLLRREKRSTM